MPQDAPTRKGILFERLCAPSELALAWRDVKAHYTGATLPAELREFDRHSGAEIDRLATELHSRSFLPAPASLIHIPKPNKPGELRAIQLEKVGDRIVLTALNRLIAPLLERQFPSRSYAYRRGQGAFTAIEQIGRLLKEGWIHTAAGDIDDFFGNINRERLLALVRKSVWEDGLLDLMETYLHIGSTAGEQWLDEGRGIAQGSPLSPILSNLYLMPFDRFLSTANVEWARYADNILILARTPESAANTLANAELFLEKECGLKFNPESRLLAGPGKGFEFLGFWFQDGRRTMHPQRLERKRLDLTALFQRIPDDLRRLVREIAETAKGWRNYYGRCPGCRRAVGITRTAHL